MGLESIPNDLHRILGPDEQVLMHVRQRIYHQKLNVESIAITNERIILRHPHAAEPGEGYTAYSYRDISSVALERGVIGSTIRCNLRTGGQRLSMYDLPSSFAQRAYTIIKGNLTRSQTPYATIGGDFQFGQPARPAGGRLKTCQVCGTMSSASQRFCGSCGAPLR